MESVGSSRGSDSELSPVTAEINTDIPSLKLRLLKEEDAEGLFLRIDQNREHLRQWSSLVDETKTAPDTLKFVHTCLEAAASGTGFRYALLLNGEIIGSAKLNTNEKIHRCATMGYWLAKSQTGEGLMTTAAKTLISEGFRQLELNRIQALVPTDTILVKLFATVRV
jgi:ribosomal-protein-serine acetyltransferase